MNVSVENLSNLERRVNVSLPITQIDSEVDERLKKLARTVKLHGFRPGKVPFRLVAQQYGPQVRQAHPQPQTQGDRHGPPQQHHQEEPHSQARRQQQQQQQQQQQPQQH